MVRSVRRVMAAGLLAGALVMSWSAPAYGAIHEIVASFCSGGNGNLEPAGQVRFGTASFLRALQASGVYTIQFGAVPAGEAAPTDGSTPVTVDVDYSRPNSKFADAGYWWVFSAEGLTVYLRAGTPDHPAFERCPKLAG